MWLWLSLTALLCWSGSVSTATNAPEELQMGEETDSSIYRRPR